MPGWWMRPRSFKHGCLQRRMCQLAGTQLLVWIKVVYYDILMFFRVEFSGNLTRTCCSGRAATAETGTLCSHGSSACRLWRWRRRATNLEQKHECATSFQDVFAKSSQLGAAPWMHSAFLSPSCGSRHHCRGPADRHGHAKLRSCCHLKHQGTGQMLSG